MDLYDKKRRNSVSTSETAKLKSRSSSNRSRYSTSFINKENKNNPSDALFEILMKDPQKKALLLEMLSQEKDAILSYKASKEKAKTDNFSSPSRSVKNRLQYESPSALLKRRAMEKRRASESGGSSSSKASDLLPSAPSAPSVPFNKLLEGVVAYVEIKSKDEDRSSGAKRLMKAMGAEVQDSFTKDVTHVVFKDGSFLTYHRAKLLKVHLVSVLWLDAIRTTKVKVPEKKFPALGFSSENNDESKICLDFQRDYEEVLKDEFQKSLAFSTSILSQSEMADKYITKRKPNLDQISNSDNLSIISSDNGNFSCLRSSLQVPKINKKLVMQEWLSGINDPPSNSSDASDIDSDCGVIDGCSTKKNKQLSILDPPITDIVDSEAFGETVDDSIDLLITTQRKSSSTNNSKSLLTGVKVRKSLNFYDRKNPNGKSSYELQDMELTSVVNKDTDLSKHFDEGNKSEQSKNDNNQDKIIDKSTDISSEMGRKIAAETPNKQSVKSDDSTYVSLEGSRKLARKSQANVIVNSVITISSTDDSTKISKGKISDVILVNSKSENDLFPNKENNREGSSLITEDMSSLKVSTSSSSRNLRSSSSLRRTRNSIMTEDLSSLKLSNSNSCNKNGSGNNKPSTSSIMTEDLSLNGNKNADNPLKIKDLSSLKATDEDNRNIKSSSKDKQLKSSPQTESLSSLKISSNDKKSNDNQSKSEDLPSLRISLENDKKITSDNNGKTDKGRKRISRISTSTSMSKNGDQKKNRHSIVTEDLSSIRISIGSNNIDSVQTENKTEIKKSDNKESKMVEEKMTPVTRQRTRKEKAKEESSNVDSSSACKSAPDTDDNANSSPDKNKHKSKMRKLFNPNDCVLEEENEEDELAKRKKAIEAASMTFKKPHPICLTPVILSENAKKYLENKKKEQAASSSSEVDELLLLELNINKTPAKTKTRKKKAEKQPVQARRSQDDEQKDLLEKCIGNGVVMNNDNSPTKLQKIPSENGIKNKEGTPGKRQKLEDSSSENEAQNVPISRRRCRSARLYSKKLTQKSQKQKEAVTPPSKRRSSLDFVPKSKQGKALSQRKTNKPKTSSIVCTRLHKPEVQVFTQIVKKLGTFYVEDEVTEKTTHLVAGESKRTINMLRALARGCWILKIEWLYKSLEAERWLDEEDFELTEFSPAVQQCRKQREAFGSMFLMDIFENVGPIYISRASTPRCSDLQELVVLCKGTVTKTERVASVVVGEHSKRDGVVCVSEKWILDSITFNKKKPFRNYLLKSSPKRTGRLSVAF